MFLVNSQSKPLHLNPRNSTPKKTKTHTQTLETKTSMAEGLFRELLEYDLEEWAQTFFGVEGPWQAST